MSRRDLFQGAALTTGLMLMFIAPEIAYTQVYVGAWSFAASVLFLVVAMPCAVGLVFYAVMDWVRPTP